MRLIDADEFRRVLRERQTDAKHYEDMELRQEIGEIIEALDDQPTACDIEKVVEQLKKDTTCICRLEGYIPKSKAIEIVKRGGVNE